MYRFTSISTQVAKDLGFSAVLGVYLVASITWAFKGDRTLLTFEFVYRLLFPVVLLVCFRKFAPPPKARLLLAGYVLLTLYMFAVAIFSEAPSDVVINTAKFLYPMLFVAALVFILHPRNFSSRLLYAIPVLGLIGAVQSLTLAVLIYSGHAPPLHDLVLVGYKNMIMPSFGVFGYAWGSIALGTPYQVFRAQSFFGEPTRMASFMEIVTLISWGLYRVRGSRWLLATAILGFITAVSCFSMTANVAAFLTGAFYFVVTRWRKAGYISPVLTLLAATMVVGLVLIYLRTATQFYDQSTSIVNMALGHADTEVSIRVRAFVNTMHLASDHPFGIGVIGVENSSILPQYQGAGDVIAPLVWLTSGGIIALVLQLVLLGYVMWTAVIPHVLEGGLRRHVALAFVILLFHHCVAGDWMDSLFLFLLASVIALDRYRFDVVAEATPQVVQSRAAASRAVNLKHG